MVFEDTACNWLICAHDDYISKWNLHMNSLTYVLETKIKSNCVVASSDYVIIYINLIYCAYIYIISFYQDMMMKIYANGT